MLLSQFLLPHLTLEAESEENAMVQNFDEEVSVYAHIFGEGGEKTDSLEINS